MTYDINIELGILRDKSMIWGEPHPFIIGAETTVQISLRKFIKWIKQQRRKNPTLPYYQLSTIEIIDEFYVVNWAFIN